MPIDLSHIIRSFRNTDAVQKDHPSYVTVTPTGQKKLDVESFFSECVRGGYFFIHGLETMYRHAAEKTGLPEELTKQDIDQWIIAKSTSKYAVKKSFDPESFMEIVSYFLYPPIRSETLVSRAAQITGLPMAQVRETYHEWILSHLTQEDINAVPNGIPFCVLPSKWKKDPTIQYPVPGRFFLLDTGVSWSERYHPFFQENADDPVRSAIEVKRYLEWIDKALDEKNLFAELCKQKEYLCLYGRAFANDPCMYIETLDQIKAHYCKYVIVSHDDDLSWEAEFSLVRIEAPDIMGREICKHPMLPVCNEAYQDGERLILHAPFFLNGWYSFQASARGEDLGSSMHCSLVTGAFVRNKENKD